jgi:hypothetical protein
MIAWRPVRRLAFCLALVSWLSVAEWKVFERLLYASQPDVDFVLASVDGIIAGTPVAKAWQQRFVGPLLVRALGGDLSALKWLHASLLLVANLLLFELLRRRRVPLANCVLAVVCFGFAHLVLVYRLEYPWDWIDVILFLFFGAWAARGGALVPLWPLLLIGAFNHETVLYIPLWYLLTPPRRQQVVALATSLGLAGVITATRALFYRGRPALPAQVFEEITPYVSNPIHVRHNLANLLMRNWSVGRGWISVGVLAAIALFATRARQPAAQWSLVILATVLCFGYFNETRHYLPLLAFWVAYAWPLPPQPAG